MRKFEGGGAGRAATCLVMRKLRSNWVFNAGEDAQRQILQAPLVRTSKIDRIFLTSSEAAVSLGLPGEAFSHALAPLARSSALFKVLKRSVAGSRITQCRLTDRAFTVQSGGWRYEFGVVLWGVFASIRAALLRLRCPFDQPLLLLSPPPPTAYVCNPLKAADAVEGGVATRGPTRPRFEHSLVLGRRQARGLRSRSMT